MFLVYLASTDESATILEAPLLRLATRPTELTDELVRNVVRECLVMNEEELPDNFEAMTGEEALAYMRNEVAIYSSENIVVVVDESNEKLLLTVGGALGRTMQDDSSSYAAAEVWGAVVTEHGLEVFDI